MWLGGKSAARRPADAVGEAVRDPGIAKFDLKLDHTCRAVNDRCVAELAQQVEHRRVAGEHRRGKALDTFLARPSGERVKQRCADTAVLPRVNDRDSGFGIARVLGRADKAGHADAISGALIDGDERLVGAVVDLG